MTKTLCFLLFFVSFFSLSSKAEHIVFVGGINNEQVPHYFESFKSLLKSRGSHRVSVLMPSSLKTVMENTTSLRTKLLEAYRSNSEPLIVIAHSKGGLEVAHTLALFAKDFPFSIIKCAVYSNTPFQGSPYMARSIDDFKEQWGRGGNQYNPIYLNALRVLNSLRTENIASDLQKSFSKLSPEEKKSLSERTVYLRTQKDAADVPEFMKKSAEFLKSFGPNDGFIPVDNQRLKDFGRDVGIQNDIDHTDLFMQEWSSESVQSVRMEAFLKKIDL